MSPAARAATVVVAAAVVLLGWFLLVPRDIYTGSNGIRVRGTNIEINPSKRTFCLPGTTIPPGSGRMELQVDTAGAPRPPLDFTLGSAHSRLGAGPAGIQKVDFAFPKTAHTETATPCIRVVGDGKAFFGGVPSVGLGQQAATVGGKPITDRAAVWFRPPAGEKQAILFHLPTLFERMARFKPTWTGAWTYWLLFLVLAPALTFFAIRVLLSPERRRLALTIGLIGAANAGMWAHVTPAFDAPDETEHFAYVQSLAERGKPLDAQQGPRPTYSSQEALGVAGTRVLDGAETADGKPPWDARYERDYDRAAAHDPPNGDGGGFAAAGSAHSPLFYSLGVPFYAAARGGGLWDELYAVRLLSALFGGLVAACACLILLELMPGRRRLAACAGLAVAFEPMFSFMSGAVNNDMGVNAACAVVTLMLVRVLRRGLNWRRALGLGAAVAIAPLMKATGYAVYPAVALTLVFAAWRARDDWRRWVPGVVVAVGAIVAVGILWGAVSGLFDRSAFTTPGGTAPGEGAPALQDPTGTLTYIWEVFLPRLPGMNEHWSQSWPAFDIFGVRGWGAFGWYALSWRHVVYWVIMIALLVLTALGLSRLPDVVRRWFPEALVLLALVGGTLGVVLAAYYSPTPQGSTYPEQGRYIFPAITSLAALFTLSTLGARRFATPLAVGLGTAVICFGYASLWLVLGGFYFAAA